MAPGATRANPGVFLKAAGKLEVAVGGAVTETLTAIEQGVKNPESATAAPYRTGALRRSYHWIKKTILSGTVGNDPGIAPYAPHVEFGTTKMAAQPHLIPSTENQREPFKARVAAAVMAVVASDRRFKAREVR